MSLAKTLASAAGVRNNTYVAASRNTVESPVARNNHMFAASHTNSFSSGIKHISVSSPNRTNVYITVNRIGS
jgi:hypothetical protein